MLDHRLFKFRGQMFVIFSSIVTVTLLIIVTQDVFA